MVLLLPQSQIHRESFKDPRFFFVLRPREREQPTDVAACRGQRVSRVSWPASFSSASACDPTLLRDPIRDLFRLAFFSI